MPWSRTWLVALALVAIIAGSWEFVLRNAGLGPRYVDDRALWADTRHRLNKQGADAVALLGASRQQRAIDVQTMAGTLNRPVFQLAVEGTSALPTLENLAVDPRFRGTVIYSIAPAFSYNRMLSKTDDGNQAKWLAYYHNQSLIERVEQRLRLLIQGALALRSPNAALPRVTASILAGNGLPQPDFKETFHDRSVYVDYARQTGRKDRQGIVDLYMQNTEPYSAAEFQAVINYFATLIDILRAKGVDVYIIRLPSDGQVLELEKQLFPDAVFWDALENGVDATFVHFEDYPELQGYLSNDGSHIESDKSAAFTQALIDVLRRNGLH
jgi:hypothetical protein